jgi:hypothetical protein
MSALDAGRHVVIVGGGFAGLGCARELADHDGVRVTLIDRNNYHQFQPLLYQVPAPAIQIVARCSRGGSRPHPKIHRPRNVASRKNASRPSIASSTMQTIWHRTHDDAWLRLTHFFGTLLLINFAIGVATGLVQEFQFGMSWAVYSNFVGGVFGAPRAGICCAGATSSCFDGRPSSR